MKNKYSIAVIAGDGIGKEVMPEGLRVLETVSAKHGINLEFTEYPFSSVDYYEAHGQMLPDDWKETLIGHDALFFGALACQTACQIIFHCGAHCCNSAVCLTNM